MDLSDIDISSYVKLIKEKKISVLEGVTFFLEKIKETDPIINAFLYVGEEEALKKANDLDSKDLKDLPLAGVPIALKDNITKKGWPTTCASKILKDWVSPYDAQVVGALEEKGAIIIGKTNMDEFAMGSSTEHSAFGPTKNPLNLEKVPGGSSGGSAAAVRAGMCLGALGSDTGGSIRQPAAFCSLVGIKPTYGLVSRFGLVAFASSLDQIGPLAKCVTDAALILDAIAGKDPKDSTSLGASGESYLPYGKLDPKSYSVGIVKELVEEANLEIKEKFFGIIDKLAQVGVKIGEVSIASFKYALPAYYLIAPAEASSNLARFDGVRYGLRANAANVEEMMILTRSEGFGEEVKRRIMLGTYVLSRGYYDAYYVRAQKLRTLMIKELKNAYRSFDVLVSPTTPTPAFGFGEKLSDPVAMYLSDLCTVPSNLAGHPAMSVPAGKTADGDAVGFQIFADALEEKKMLEVAFLVESANGQV